MKSFANDNLFIVDIFFSATLYLTEPGQLKHLVSTLWPARDLTRADENTREAGTNAQVPGCPQLKAKVEELFNVEGRNMKQTHLTAKNINDYSLKGCSFERCGEN